MSSQGTTCSGLAWSTLRPSASRTACRSDSSRRGQTATATVSTPMASCGGRPAIIDRSNYHQPGSAVASREKKQGQPTCDLSGRTAALDAGCCSAPHRLDLSVCGALLQSRPSHAAVESSPARCRCKRAPSPYSCSATRSHHLWEQRRRHALDHQVTTYPLRTGC